MRRRRSWFIVLIVLGLLVAACGPEMATPTPAETEAVKASPAPEDTQVKESPQTATPTAETLPLEPVSYADLVDPQDWHSLGSPDAPVTMVEYSDFQ